MASVGGDIGCGMAALRFEREAAVLATVPSRASGFPQEVRDLPGALTFHLRPSNRE